MNGRTHGTRRVGGVVCGSMGRPRRGVWRALAVAVTVLLALVASPRQAQAGMFDNVLLAKGAADGNIDDTYVVRANTRFDALMVMLNQSGGAADWGLNDDQRTALSNEGTGGRFYQLSSAIAALGPDNVPEFDDAVSNVTVSAFTSLWGWVDVWGATFSEDELAGALEDLNVVRAGGSLGGGLQDLTGYHGFGSVSVPYPSNQLAFSPNSKVRVYDSVTGSTYTSVDAPTVWQHVRGFYVKDETYAALSAAAQSKGVALNDRTFVFGISNGTLSGSVVTSYDINCCLTLDPDGYIEGVDRDTYRRYFAYTASGSRSNLGYFYSAMSTRVVRDGDDYILVSTQNKDYFSTRSGTMDFKLFTFVTGVSGGGGGGNNNWPSGGGDEGGDEGGPDVPGPPDPDPHVPPDPPVPDPPTPTPPTPPGPPEPDPVIPTPEPTGTSAADYTPWLQAILTALNTINGSLGTHCLHILQRLDQCTSYLYDALDGWFSYYYTQVCKYVGKVLQAMTTSINGTLNTEFNQLKSYLRRLTQWLADELDFTVSGGDYDDSTVVSWLKHCYQQLGMLVDYVGQGFDAVDSAISDVISYLQRILNKIPSGGGGGGRPEVEDPDEDIDWWAEFLQRILDAIGSILGDFVGDLGEVLDLIKDKFPFSIPWDIAAILGALATPAVTPVVTITIPAFLGVPSYRYVVDLHPFDSAMEPVRAMELALWSVYLAFRTDWLLALFDRTTDKVGSSVTTRLVGGKSA